MDDLTSGKAIDALLNFETVNLFNNATIEVAQYDQYLRGYQKAALDTERLSALLNAGQGAILAVGLTAVCCAANVGGAATAGDLVMISGLLLQLWAPLQFLGFFYRELRRSLVDMEAFFDIMKTDSQLVDGKLELCSTHTDEAALNGGHNGTHAAVPAACAGFMERGIQLQLDDVHFGYRDRKVSALRL
jgi:ABC-type transport system involved in Fe-S cluster assembly fused permease/ATPase subunit